MSVLQNWVVALPLRMQSTLILGLRGPDTHACPNIKTITRWLRGLTFKPGNPHNVQEFMGTKPERIIEKGPTAKELEFCTQHFYSHLMHALEVVGYEYRAYDSASAYLAFCLYCDMVYLMHLSAETSEDFKQRLRTMDWPEGKQPDNFDEAVALLNAHQPKEPVNG